jgi:hypothetical protein
VLKRRKVSWVKLHIPVYLPEVGEMRGYLPSNEKTLENLVMERDEAGDLEITFKYKGHSKNAVLPKGTVAIMDLIIEPVLIKKVESK